MRALAGIAVRIVADGTRDIPNAERNPGMMRRLAAGLGALTPEAGR